MIVSKNTSPQNDIYYLGSLALEELANYEGERADFFEVYDSLRKKHQISMNVFGLVLDWLFLLGAIKSEERYIVKCF